jgi:hypothetical protein
MIDALTLVLGLIITLLFVVVCIVLMVIKNLLYARRLRKKYR